MNVKENYFQIQNFFILNSIDYTMFNSKSEQFVRQTITNKRTHRQLCFKKYLHNIRFFTLNRFNTKISTFSTGYSVTCKCYQVCNVKVPVEIKIIFILSRVVW